MFKLRTRTCHRHNSERLRLSAGTQYARLAIPSRKFSRKLLFVKRGNWAQLLAVVSLAARTPNLWIAVIRGSPKG